MKYICKVINGNWPLSANLSYRLYVYKLSNNHLICIICIWREEGAHWLILFKIRPRVFDHYSIESIYVTPSVPFSRIAKSTGVLKTMIYVLIIVSWATINKIMKTQVIFYDHLFDNSNHCAFSYVKSLLSWWQFRSALARTKVKVARICACFINKR